MYHHQYKGHHESCEDSLESYKTWGRIRDYRVNGDHTYLHIPMARTFPSLVHRSPEPEENRQEH